MACPEGNLVRCLEPPIIVASVALILLLFAAAPSQAEPPQIQINGDATTEMQNEEQIVVNPTDPDNVVACWRDFRLGYRQVGVGYSFDGGFSWTDFLIGGEFSYDSDPVLTVHSDGTFYLSVLNLEPSAQNQISVHRSVTGGASWEGPFTAVFSDCQPLHDKEWIAVDRSGGPRDGNVYVAWVQVGDDYGIKSVTSTDRAEHWTLPADVSDPGSIVQWPVPIVLRNGDLLVAWDDVGRGNISYDISSDAGSSWGTDQILTPTTTPGSSTINGEILVYPYPSLALDETAGPRAGYVYCVYADEAVAGNGMDIWCRRSTNNGSSWSEPVRVNDDPAGRALDQYHPWVVCDETGVLHATWYDRRDDDPANYLWHIYYARSFNGGATWTSNQRITDVPSSPTNLEPSTPIPFCEPGGPEFRGSPSGSLPPAMPPGAAPLRAGNLGEYSGVAARGGVVHPVWTDTRNGNGDVFTSVVVLPPNESPDCSEASAEPTELWPPKHGFRAVNIIGVTDPEGDPITITIDGVTQDEPVIGPTPAAGELMPGDGHTCPDARIVAGQLELRAERAGNRLHPGNGRVYEVSFTASDGNGGSCSGTVSVCVPHDFRSGDQCVDDGQMANSLGPCETFRPEGGNTEISAVRLDAPALIHDDVAIIKYAIPEDGEVSLAVFNVAGRRVALLENSFRVSGTHQVTWDTNGLARGIYYCRIQAVGFSLTKELSLVN